MCLFREETACRIGWQNSINQALDRLHQCSDVTSCDCDVTWMTRDIDESSPVAA